MKQTKINLGKDASFKGVMTFEKPLKIAGKYEGTIESQGYLVVEEGAEVRADIHVGRLVVGGTVYGDIMATEGLTLLETGKVYGNINTSSLRVEEGFEFRGKCQMIKDPLSVDIFSMSAAHLKKSLSEQSE